VRGNRIGSGMSELTDWVAARSSSYNLDSSSTSIASFGSTTKRFLEFSNGWFWRPTAQELVPAALGPFAEDFPGGLNLDLEDADAWSIASRWENFACAGRAPICHLPFDGILGLGRPGMTHGAEARVPWTKNSSFPPSPHSQESTTHP